MTLLEEIKLYNVHKNPLQLKYYAYITDTTISIDDRWEVFKAVPFNFKEHEAFVHHFDMEKELLVTISWYDDFYISQHQTVKLTDIVEQIEDQIEDDFGQWTTELCTKFKEEILLLNLGSFEYDW